VSSVSDGAPEQPFSWIRATCPSEESVGMILGQTRATDPEG